MSVAMNDIHPANSISAYLLSGIMHAPTAFEARLRETRTYELIFKLQIEETISKLDADNLRILFRVALEKRLYEIVSE